MRPSRLPRAKTRRTDRTHFREEGGRGGAMRRGSSAGDDEVFLSALSDSCLPQRYERHGLGLLSVSGLFARLRARRGSCLGEVFLAEKHPSALTGDGGQGD